MLSLKSPCRPQHHTHSAHGTHRPHICRYADFYSNAGGWCGRSTGPGSLERCVLLHARRTHGKYYCQSLCGRMPSILSAATLETGTCRAEQCGKAVPIQPIVGYITTEQIACVCECVRARSRASAFVLPSMCCGFLICYELQLCFFIVLLCRLSSNACATSPYSCDKWGRHSIARFTLVFSLLLLCLSQNYGYLFVISRTGFICHAKRSNRNEWRANFIMDFCRHRKWSARGVRSAVN